MSLFLFQDATLFSHVSFRFALDVTAKHKFKYTHTHIPTHTHIHTFFKVNICSFDFFGSPYSEKLFPESYRLMILWKMLFLMDDIFWLDYKVFGFHMPDTYYTVQYGGH